MFHQQATLVFLLDHLSLVVSNSERNKMSAQALATVMGPPLMLHSASAQPGSDIDHAQPIAVLKYLLQIWPQPQSQHHQSATGVGAPGNLMGSMAGVGGSTMGMGLGMGLGMSAGSMSNMAGVVSGNVILVYFSCEPIFGIFFYLLLNFDLINCSIFWIHFVAQEIRRYTRINK